MTLIGRLTRALGIYDWLRYSSFYDLVLRVRNPAYLKALNEDEAFYRRLLSGHKVDLIFDVGANMGDKAEVFARIAPRVICFEPDPRLAEHLRKRFQTRPQVTIEECGISDHAGSANLNTYDEGSAFNTFNDRQHQLVLGLHKHHQMVSVRLVTLDAMIEKYGCPGFLKVDVEGHEKEVFAGLSTPVPMISYEANLPTFAGETCEVARHLASLSHATYFGLGGSGIEMNGDFPMTLTEFCEWVSGPQAPNFVEVFARP